MGNFDILLEALQKSLSFHELVFHMDSIIRGYGFSSFSYLDIRKASSIKSYAPFLNGTLNSQFIAEYYRQNFLDYDPVLRKAVFSNRPFSWWECPEFTDTAPGGKKTKARQIIRFAQDFGYPDGWIIPIHSVDDLGNINTAVLALYLRQRKPIVEDHPKFPRFLQIAARLYHEKILEFRDMADFHPLAPPVLKDKERDCLVLACRGKTFGETADILNITERTVKFHFANAAKKLNVRNKSHAIAQALCKGLIVP